MDKLYFRMFIMGLIITAVTATGYASDMDMAMDGEGMSEEQMAMHQRMMDYSTVNEHHDLLKSLAGKWNTHVRFWMDPAGEPQESDGISEGSIIMGGRFLEQRFTGSMMDQPFEGRGIFGYDNLRKEYTGLWFDNMSTGVMVSSAQYDPETKAIVEEGSMSCPITNEPHRWFKGVTTIKDADHYTYESFMKDQDGREFRAMEITYTRAEE